MDQLLPDALLGTDRNGSVLNGYAAAAQLGMVYSPYGYRAEWRHLPIHAGFNGQRQDSLTGCYHLGNGRRAFNPVLMRFNRPDDLSPFDEGGLNCYAYCAGDPINAADPSGQFPSFPPPFARLFGKSRGVAAGADVGVDVAKSTRYHRHDQYSALTQQSFPEFSDVRSHGRKAFSFSDQGVFHLAGHGDRFGNIYFGRLRPRTPAMAYRRLLKDGVDFSQYKSVYLQICYSAGGLGQEGAKRFARLTGLPTTGHVGVGKSTSNYVARNIRLMGTKSVIEEHVRNHYRVTIDYVDHAPANKSLKETAKYKYHTKVFSP